MMPQEVTEQNQEEVEEVEEQQQIKVLKSSKALDLIFLAHKKKKQKTFRLSIGKNNRRRRLIRCRRRRPGSATSATIWRRRRIFLPPPLSILFQTSAFRTKAVGGVDLNPPPLPPLLSRLLPFFLSSSGFIFLKTGLQRRRPIKTSRRVCIFSIFIFFFFFARSRLDVTSFPSSLTGEKNFLTMCSGEIPH